MPQRRYLPTITWKGWVERDRRVVVAAINAPEQITLSGNEDALGEIAEGH